MLKTYAATYVSLQENLSNAQKISIIKWIKEAESDEIKSLLVTGKFDIEENAIKVFDKTLGVFLNEALPVSPSSLGFKGLLSADSKFFTGIVDMDKFNNAMDLIMRQKETQGILHGYNMGAQVGAVGGLAVGIGASAIVALVIVIANRAYKRFLSKAARACNNLSGDNKTSCMEKFRKQALTKKMSDLQKGEKSCKHAKNPVKCKTKIDNKINKIKAKLGELHNG